MKVQVNIKTLTSETVQLNLTVSPADSVQAIKERVVLAEPNPFGGQALLFRGAPLSDGATLSECGLEDGSSLDFQARATSEALATQLEDLIASKGALPVEELGLLYTLKHGVSVGTVLQALGKHSLLSAFLGSFGNKFIVTGDRVELVTQPPKASDTQQILTQPLKKIPEDTAVEVVSVTISVGLKLPTKNVDSESVSLRVNTSETVRAVKDSVAAFALVPFTERSLYLDGVALMDDQPLSECGVTNEAQLEFSACGSEEAVVAQLLDIVKSHGPLSKVDLDNYYCSRHGVPAGDALRMLGWGEKLLPFVQRCRCFSVKGSCVSLAEGAEVPVSPAVERTENQRLVDLHEELCADDFQLQVAKALDAIAQCISESTFLNVRRVVPGGAVAKGVSIPGAAGAELVMFLDGLPHARQDSWLASLAPCVASTLAEQLGDLPGILGASASKGVVTLATESLLGDVRIFFAPEYASYSEALAALHGQTLEMRAYGGAAFVAQKARFVERQPEGVKATIRLMRWWREQQEWSCECARPSDELLELVVAHTAAEHPPKDLASAVSGALSALAGLEQLSITWPLASRCYKEPEVWKPLLSQRPLVLDPTNPLVNVANSQAFDIGETMVRARAGMSLI